MYVYLELPEGKVPSELIAGVRGARSRLYVIDSPIEEIHADMTKRVGEVLILRSSMASLASIFGFEADIPTSGNGLGWEALSRKVTDRAQQLNDHVSARLEDLGLKRPRRKTTEKVV